MGSWLLARRRERIMHFRIAFLLLTSCTLASGCWKDDASAPAGGHDEEDASRVEFNGAALEAMRTYLGKDLERLDEAEGEQVMSIIKMLVPGRSYRDVWDFKPWRFWAFGNEEGDPLYLLFEADNSGPHPGSTGIRLTLVNESSERPLEFVFHTAHRCYMQGVKLEVSEGFTSPLIIIETGYGPGPGPGYEQQYYTLIGNRIDLIRLEYANAEPARNHYYVKHFACGPELPVQTAAEWEADFLSSDRGRVLRALVWMSGTHRKLEPNMVDEGQEENAQSVRLVNDVRNREKVIRRLRELAESKEKWFREGAELTMRPDDRSWGR
jgi:hypothetical protein